MAAFERLHDRDAAEPVIVGTRPYYVLAWTERTALKGPPALPRPRRLDIHSTVLHRSHNA